MTRSDYTPSWADTLPWHNRDTPESELLEHVPDPQSPGVYVLRLLQPKTASILKDLWGEWYDSEPPDWAWAAYYADEVYYVGGTGNLAKRVREHIDPEGARIEAAFPVWKVESATATPNRTAAIEYEPKRAEELRSETGDDVFVYQA